MLSENVTALSHERTKFDSPARASCNAETTGENILMLRQSPPPRASPGVPINLPNPSGILSSFSSPPAWHPFSSHGKPSHSPPTHHIFRLYVDNYKYKGRRKAVTHREIRIRSSVTVTSDISIDTSRRETTHMLRTAVCFGV
ncbi:hypothetical protein J6590_051904 [Homalodisca vitripennis]|nr:hypothetical protein J6590_051904 [Homalodisca vitripennis]